MDKTAKLFAKIGKKDLLRIREATVLLQNGAIEGITLRGKEMFRYRVGNYRILYIKVNGKNIIIEVRKRNEGTYK
jgi:mRNA-degrading endonuclease RelE of RelBE toxin-antitoxin system